MKIKDQIIQFINSGIIQKNEHIFYCQTRDQANARLPNWIDQFQKSGLGITDSILLGSILGELTNNSFDHNLGHWNTVTGCAVGFQKIEKDFFVYIADRGQGIISSLQHTIPQIVNGDIVLKKAFEERISGRAPEKRGNGLKYVMKHIVDKNNSLLCISEGKNYSYNGNSLLDSSEVKTSVGTLIVIRWGINDPKTK